MATYQDGNRAKATPNSRTAARRSAESRRCPKCQRKSALIHVSEPEFFGSACRWDDCTYTNFRNRDAAPNPSKEHHP